MALVSLDAATCIKGRKQLLLLDTMGLVLGVSVAAANLTERAVAQVVLDRVLIWFAWLRVLQMKGVTPPNICRLGPIDIQVNQRIEQAR